MGCSSAFLLGGILSIVVFCAADDSTELKLKGIAVALHPTFDPSSVNNEDGEGRLPLVNAILDGHLDTAEVLLSYYANASLAESASGMNALMVAFSEKNFEAAWLMLRYGGNPDVHDVMGRSARSMAPSHPILQKYIHLYDSDGALAFEDPPGAWGKALDPDTTNTYFYNFHTQMATYHPPPSCAWYRTELDGHPIYMNSVTHQTSFGRPDTLSWRRLISISEEAFFWLNFKTNQTSVNEPAEMPQELLNEEIARTGHYWYNKITGKTTWQDPSEVMWREAWADTGKRYWYNPINSETSWSMPEPLAWIEVPYEENPEKVYWWNEVTHESSRRAPESLAWVLSQHKSDTVFHN